MRQFNVIVKLKKGRRRIKYPELPGEKSLSLMETLEKRGFESYAVTSANGITEELNLDEMKEIFD